MHLFTFEQGRFFSPTPILNPLSEKADATVHQSPPQEILPAVDDGHGVTETAPFPDTSRDRTATQKFVRLKVTLLP